MKLVIKGQEPIEDIIELQLIQCEDGIRLKAIKGDKMQTLCKIYPNGDMRTFENAWFTLRNDIDESHPSHPKNTRVW